MSTTTNIDDASIINETLPFDSINPTGASTILVIHGAFTTSHDWDPVISHLPSTYHILAPDLPAHGRAATMGITPFTVTSAAAHLAALILNEAHGGVAHVVGLSMGAHVAAHLASRYPDRVLTVFASGFKIIQPSFLKPVMPSLFWGMQSVTDMLPRGVVGRAMDGAELSAPQKGVVTKALCAEVLRMMEPEAVRADVGPVRAKMLVVAATKSGIVPSGDGVEDARLVLGFAKGDGNGSQQSRAVKHGGMRHPWNRQDPKLFAEALLAWVEQGAVLEGFEVI